MDSQPPPVAKPRRGFAGLAIASFAFALAFLPAPLAVLYELNDECLRTTSWASSEGLSFATLAHIPPIPIHRHVYLMVRTAALGGVVASLFLVVAAVVSYRSRPWAIRLHTIYVATQLVLMVTLIKYADAFSTELDTAQAARDWVMRLPFHSTVRQIATMVAMPGLVFPLVLAFVYWLWSRSYGPARDRHRNRRLPGATADE